jgi:hypothetical protein
MPSRRVRFEGGYRLAGLLFLLDGGSHPVNHPGPPPPPTARHKALDVVHILSMQQKPSDRWVLASWPDAA